MSIVRFTANCTAPHERHIWRPLAAIEAELAARAVTKHMEVVTPDQSTRPLRNRATPTRRQTKLPLIIPDERRSKKRGGPPNAPARMMHPQIAEAQKLAREWKPQTPK